jgi:hypothetical protein
MQELMTTAAGIGRDETEIEEFAESLVPTEEWIRQYQKQATPQVIAGLNQYARTRALTVADAGRKVDDYYARELVLDALGDTWLQIARWDPAACSLVHHVRRTIEGRADKHRKHALKRPHDSLGDETVESRMAESDASELVGDDELAVTRVHATETMTKIRATAAKDASVLRILDAYDAGCSTKDEVLVHASMKNRTYHNAYGRLRRIVRNLTDCALTPKARA